MKNSLKISIPIGLGDILYVKAMLDAIKNNYNEIRLKFNRELIESCRLNPNYNHFLNEIGLLLFSTPPYILTEEFEIPFFHLASLCKQGIDPVKPNLGYLLCKGNPLQLEQKYIVIVTKVRDLSRNNFNIKSHEMWQLIRKLSNKYKIVILGERKLQINAAYNESCFYSIYSDIKNNIPIENIIDLSLSTLEIDIPQLSQIQQDCLIMSKAEFVLTLGIGGGFCMATSVGNTIGYREDEDPIADIVFKKQYDNVIVTKDWSQFIYALNDYL